MVDKDKVKKLLGLNLSTEVVAATVGCDASYISQLMSEDSFRDEVVALRIESLTAASMRDASIDAIEESLIEKLAESVQYFVKPTEVLSAFKVLNDAKRRGVGVSGQAQVASPTVQLTIPVVVQQKFVVDSKSEVVEVDGRTAISMSPTQLLNQLAARKELTDATKAEELRRLAARLPTAVLANAG